MSLTVVSEPLKSNAGVTNSNVLAVRTQAFYEFKREDVQLNQGISLVTNKIITLDNIDLTSSPYNWAVGDSLFIDYELQAGGQAQDVTPIVAITFSSPDTIVEVAPTAIPGSKSTTPVQGYINNLSQNYRVQFEIFDNVSGEQLASPLVYKPRQNGVLKCDLAAGYDYTIIQDLNRWLKIDYTEITDDGELSPPASLTTIQAVRAQRGQLISGGSNLVDYLMYNGNLGTANLTTFDSARVWRGWAWASYYIIDSELDPRIGISLITEVMVTLDINKNLIGGIAQPTVGTLPVRIEKGWELLSSQNLDNIYFLRLNVERQGLNDITGYYFAQVVDECDNPIMVEWENTLGGIDQFLFSYNQEVEEVAQVGTTLIPPLDDDIENEQTLIKRQAEISTQLITCFADHLTSNEIRTLHYIKLSDRVSVWLDKDGDKKVDVIIEDIYTTDYTTRQNLGSFSVKLRFPDNFSFFEAKQY